MTDVATFRGVAFLVDSGELTGGRRNVPHEYPFRDDPPNVEDTGGKGATFPVEGFVNGDDYLTARDALIKALNTKGSAELVHPRFGTRRVVCDSFRVRESAGELRIARFSIQFIETSGVTVQSIAVPDAAAAVVASADNALTAVGAEFLAAYNVISALRDSVAGALTSATDAVGTVLDAVAMGTQAVAAMRVQVAEMADAVDTLADAPDDLLTSVTELIESVGDGLLEAAAAADPTRVLLKLYDFDPGTRPPATTPNREIEQTNFDATQRLIQRVVVIQAAKLAVEQTFTSYEEAVRVRLSIVDLIDAQAETASDDTYPPLQQLRADLVNAVPGDGSDLPRLLTHTPPVTVPSLVLAHSLYGDLELEADVLARNRVVHPGFVPGSVELEVLSDE